VKALKRTIIYLIISVFLFGLLPFALAAPEEDVLTSIAHAGALKCTWNNSRTITLTVRNSYGNTLDLTNGLNIAWNSLVYKDVVATPETASVAVSDDDTFEGDEIVDLVVTYYLKSESEDPTQWQTTYHIRARRDDPAPAVFSGTVSRGTNYEEDNTVEFTSADFIPLFSNIDGDDIGAIAISGSNPTFGTIQAGGLNYNLSNSPLIPIEKNSVGDPTAESRTIFTFEASSTGTVSYNISAFAGADETHPIGNVVVTIRSYEAPEIHTPISRELSKGAVATFSTFDFESRSTLFGVPLEAVAIKPINTTVGTWSVGSKPITTETTVTVGQLPSLTFTANAAGTATFTWTVTTKGGTSAPGNGTFVITSPKLVLEPFNADDPIMKGTPWSVQATHFNYTPVTASLSYVKITALPLSADGYLYLTDPLPKNDTYGYPALAANTALPNNAIIPEWCLDDLRLATKSTSTNTAVSFKWTATADAKVSTAVWGEPVTYTVGFISAGVLNVSTDMNIPLPFNSAVTAFGTLLADQIAAFQAGGQQLSYITFTVPDKNVGTLYFNYDYVKKTGTGVTAATKYYAAKSPNLSKITFAPAKDYTGTADISYNAYLESGVFITGKIRITVSNNLGGTFSYITDKNSPLQFDATDFQNAFFSATGKALGSVSFSFNSSLGYLCYDYKLSGDYASGISSSQYYYVNKANYLSLVTFVPASDVTGPVVVGYTGYAQDGSVSRSGKLYIYVVDSPAGIVQYSVKANGTAALSADDFSNEFIGVTGALMSYVTFTPPAAATGSMFYQYDAETGSGTKVTSAVKYYNGKGPDLSDITFVPAKDFTGVCVVPYTGYTTTGAAYTGKLKFTVFEGSEIISYSTGAGKPVTMNASGFTSAFYINSDGRALSYVTFEPPSASFGKLYYNYTSPVKYDYAVTADKKFYTTASPFLSNVTFVPQEGYAGTFTLNYTGYTSGGSSVTGKIKITVTSAQSGSVTY
jgi:hypothetical protein